MNKQILIDIKTLIDGNVKDQVSITNKYLNWGIDNEDFEALSDGEVLDLIYDILKGVKT
jgi:hypothetical protein